jgi:uncharacterized ferredoxin-like protein
LLISDTLTDRIGTLSIEKQEKLEKDAEKAEKKAEKKAEAEMKKKEATKVGCCFLRVLVGVASTSAIVGVGVWRIGKRHVRMNRMNGWKGGFT